jgi:acyl-ACP thioesterase
VYQIKTQVFLSNSDMNGQLRFDAAMDMMQDCSVLWTESEGSFKKYLQDNNLIMILVNRQADVLRMPLYRERLTVETSIYECKGAFGLRNTGIYDDKHKPCLVSWATGAFVNSDTARPFRLSPEITDHIVLDPRIEMEYLGRRIDVPEAPDTLSAGKKFPPVLVTALEIDINRHMNNGHYIKAALRFLPDSFIISRFRIEYKKPAAKGDIVYPVIKEAMGDKIYILLTDEMERPYAVMKFSGSRHNNF